MITHSTPGVGGTPACWVSNIDRCRVNSCRKTGSEADGVLSKTRSPSLARTRAC